MDVTDARALSMSCWDPTKRAKVFFGLVKIRLINYKMLEHPILEIFYCIEETFSVRLGHWLALLSVSLSAISLISLVFIISTSYQHFQHTHLVIEQIAFKYQVTYASGSFFN